MGRRFDPDRAHVTTRGKEASLSSGQRSMIIKKWSLYMSIVATALIVTPWHNLDAVNPPKQLSLVLLTSIAVILQLSNFKKSLRINELRTHILIVTLVIFWILITLITNNYSLGERIFGIYGRHLGVLTFVSLFSLMIAASVASVARISDLSTTIIFVSLGIAIYYMLQIWNLDPATWSIVYEQSPSSTLGNPNYVSAFLAIGATLTLGRLFKFRNLNIVQIIFYFMTTLFLLWVVQRTQSFQGLVIFTASVFGFVSFQAFTYWKQNDTAIWKRISILSLSLSFFFVIPLLSASVRDQVFQGFLNARLDYWLTGIKITLNNFIFGVGFDAYGDFYSRYKPQDAQFFSDSAHNLWIELAVFGGVPLLLFYLIVQAQILTKSIKVILSPEANEFRILFLAWIGFHIQSLVSPSSLALLTVGFLTSGIIYSESVKIIRSTNERGEISESPISTPKKSNNIQERSLTGIIVALSLLASFMAFIPLAKDSRFRDAIEVGSGAEMINQTNKWPFNSQIAIITARTLSDNNYKGLSKSLLRKAANQNPESSQILESLLNLEENPNTRRELLAKLKKLDPLSPLFDSSTQ